MKTVHIAVHWLLLPVFLVPTLTFADTPDTAVANDVVTAESTPREVTDQPSVAHSDTSLSDVTPDNQKSTPVSRTTPLSLTIRGGSSLGAYEAGYLYMLTEAIKRNPEYFTPEILTGASAGAINSVLSIISLGTAPQDNPLRSVYFNIWRQLNFRELVDISDQKTPPGALSSRKLLWRIADTLRTEWEKGFPEDFSLVVGISTTRLLPETITTDGGLDIPNQQAKFVFTVQGRGAGKAPGLQNIKWMKSGLEQLLLPFTGNSSQDFESMMQVAFASCGIPIVFPPQPIDYCKTKINETDTLHCDPQSTFTDSFVDGGVVDNSPIHLAYRLDKVVRETSPVTAHLNQTVFSYLDPEHLRYPENNTAAKQHTGEAGPHRLYPYGLNLFHTLPKFLSGFISSSRSSEIYSLLNLDPDVHIERTENSFAPVSALLSGQMGFLEREILKYDFYLGMHDAENYLRQTVILYLQQKVDPGITPDDIKLPMDAKGATKLPGWAPYACMRAMFDGEGDKEQACDFQFSPDDPLNPPSAQDFKILMQVSIDRVYSHCSLLSNTTENRNALQMENGLCRQAFEQGESPQLPLVPGVQPLKNDQWYQCIAEKDAKTAKEKKRACLLCHNHRENENEYQYVTRLMGAYRFHFKDLGLTRSQANEIRQTIQTTLFSVVDEFVSKYKTVEINPVDANSENAKTTYSIGKVSAGDRIKIRIIGKPAITFLDYSPPRNIVSIIVGKGTALSWSHSRSGWLRFNWNLLQIGGLDTLNDHFKVATFTNAAGLEWQPPWFSSAIFQSTLIVRGGYQLSTRGHFSDASCGNKMEESTNRCSLPVFQTVISASLLSRIRLELGANIFPAWAKISGMPNQHWHGAMIAALGFQFLD